MRLEVIHDTLYDYATPVDTALHVAHLEPRVDEGQALESYSLVITPTPASLETRADFYGNRKTFFSLSGRHTSLKVSARSLVRTPSLQSFNPSQTSCWEDVCASFKFQKASAWHAASDFLFPSPYIVLGEEFKAYAASSFTARRPLLEAAIDLMQRVHRDMRYVSQSTDLQTKASEALKQRQGVCQDFAHILISCLRAMGIPSRYVSGYLLTEPPPGQPRLIGADASHAWASVYVPQNGTGHWVDLDPTNNRWGSPAPGEDYVVIARGRDFGDVSPLRGVIHGGSSHRLTVAVTVRPPED
jgi:transglutaminase-like putative cysteine protease